jgi:hypothetical protein
MVHRHAFKVLSPINYIQESDISMYRNICSSRVQKHLFMTLIKLVKLRKIIKVIILVKVIKDEKATRFINLTKLSPSWIHSLFSIFAHGMIYKSY